MESNVLLQHSYISEGNVSAVTAEQLFPTFFPDVVFYKMWGHISFVYDFSKHVSLKLSTTTFRPHSCFNVAVTKGHSDHVYNNIVQKQAA